MALARPRGRDADDDVARVPADGRAGVVHANIIAAPGEQAAEVLCQGFFVQGGAVDADQVEKCGYQSFGVDHCRVMSL